MGLVNIDLGDGPAEFLHLTYAGDATLYVPVAMLHLIGRYSGAAPENGPPAHAGFRPVGQGPSQGRRKGT